MRKFTQLGIAVLLGASVAAAAPILTITNVTAGFTNSSALLGASDVILEDFEGFTLGNQGTSVATAIGDFSVTGGNGTPTGACIEAGGDPTTCDTLHVLDAVTSPFGGRFNTTAGGSKWLDSNDITGIDLTFTLAPALSNLFFFITDVQDVDGILTIEAADGGMTSTNFGAVPGGLSNGQVFLVRAQAMGGSTLSKITFSNTSNNDGFGVDDFGTTVPEPSSMLLLGSALLGLGWMRSRRNKS